MTGEMTAAAIAWLRFGRQIPYVAAEFEVGMHRCDIYAASAESAVEVEVKASRYDLRRDFEAKDLKHRIYGDNARAGVPNRLYFLVPERLGDEAATLLEQKAPRYGLLIYRPIEPNDYRRPWEALSSKRRASILHTQPPSPKILERLAARMSSDLAHIYLMRPKYGALLEEMTRLSQACQDPKGSLEP